MAVMRTIDHKHVPPGSHCWAVTTSQPRLRLVVLRHEGYYTAAGPWECSWPEKDLEIISFISIPDELVGLQAYYGPGGHC